MSTALHFTNHFVGQGKDVWFARVELASHAFDDVVALVKICKAHAVATQIAYKTMEVTTMMTTVNTVEKNASSQF